MSTDATADRPRPKTSFFRGIRSFVMVIAVLAAVRSSVADWNDVPSQSMEPTILTGDRIAVNKLAYGLRIPFTMVHLVRWDSPAAGEVVVFFAPHDERRMVKRVVGGPGDVLELRDNRLVINGTPAPVTGLPRAELEAALARVRDLSDPPPHRFFTERLDGTSDHAILLQPRKRSRRSFGPVTVPAGHYFVMGDNRDNSGDSRTFGVVAKRRIVGRVVGVALSFDRKRNWRPRWSRFLKDVD